MNSDKKAAKPFRTLAYRLVLIVASLVISLVLGEVLFRVFSPKEYFRPQAWFDEIGEWRYLGEIIALLEEASDEKKEGPGTKWKPNVRVRLKYDRPLWDYFDEEGCIDCITNDFGFRDDPFELEKPEDEYRILTVGDSFTTGLGVPHELCWVEVLEELLQEARKQPVQVINGGFACGYLPALYTDWIKSDGVAFQPDAVIIGFCLNDMHVAIPMLAYPKLGAEEAWLGGRSKLLYQVQSYLHKRKNLNDKTKDYADLVDDQPACWNANKEALIEMKNFLDQKGIRFIVAVFPMMSGLKDHYPYHRCHQIVGDFCREQGIECVDVLDRFLGLDERGLWAHPNDQHPNGKGNRLIAEGIFEYLMANEEKPTRASGNPLNNEDGK